VLEFCAGIVLMITLVVGTIMGVVMFAVGGLLWCVCILPHVIVCHTLGTNPGCTAEMFEISSQDGIIFLAGEKEISEASQDPA